MYVFFLNENWKTWKDCDGEVINDVRENILLMES